jgi:ferredoxin
MPTLTITYANETREIECDPNRAIGEMISASGFPLEQPCAGRGTCGKCKVIAEGALAPHDEVEQKHLLAAERAANVRLACRARVMGKIGRAHV